MKGLILKLKNWLISLFKRSENEPSEVVKAESIMKRQMSTAMKRIVEFIKAEPRTTFEVRNYLKSVGHTNLGTTLNILENFQAIGLIYKDGDHWKVVGHQYEDHENYDYENDQVDFDEQ